MVRISITEGERQIATSYWGLLIRNPIYLALADRKFAIKRAEMLLVAEAGLEPAQPYG